MTEWRDDQKDRMRYIRERAQYIVDTDPLILHMELARGDWREEMETLRIDLGITLTRHAGEPALVFRTGADWNRPGILAWLNKREPTGMKVWFDKQERANVGS